MGSRHQPVPFAFVVLVPGCDKGKVNLQQQFHPDQEPFRLALIDQRDHASQFKSQGGQNLSGIFAKDRNSMDRIGPAAVIAVRQNIFIKAAVFPLQLIDRQAFKRPVLEHPAMGQKKQDPLCSSLKIGYVQRMDCRLPGHETDPLQREPESLAVKCIG